MLPLIDLHSQLDEALNINSSDSVFDDLYYTDLINEQRALLLRNEYNKSRTLDPNIQQEIGCLELELVDAHTCCSLEIPIKCKVLRSKKQIPNTIELYYRKGITSVGPVDITKKRFTVIDYNRVPYAGNGRTTQKSIYTFLYDNYIYIISKDLNAKFIKYINVRGIFEDPTALGEFTDCSGAICWGPSDTYPLNQWMWVYMKPQIIQQLLQKQQIPQDAENDSKDNKTDLRTQSAKK
jgi:hypothetical protein